jgi:hypothetical protein
MTETLQLIGVFVNTLNLNETIKEIIQNNFLPNKKIYILRLEDIPDNLFCSYNIIKEKQPIFGYVTPNSVILHRKHQTNTIYTINALNKLLELENSQYDIDWKKYKNKLITTSKNNMLNIYNTQLYSIISTDKIKN